MNTIVLHEHFRIPDTVVDLESFRAWAKSKAFPARGRYSYFDDELWVDLMAEQLFTHNDVKMEFSDVLRRLFKKNRRGRFFGDRTQVTNVRAGLSTEPDGTVVLFQSLEEGRVQFVKSSSEKGYIEIEGVPDIVLEIVSKGSIQKDTVKLPVLYWKAGIPEYWLVDARGNRPVFDILKRGRNGYVAARKSAGWVRSTVLAESFRLARTVDAAGNPEFTLTARTMN